MKINVAMVRKRCRAMSYAFAIAWAWNPEQHQGCSEGNMVVLSFMRSYILVCRPGVARQRRDARFVVQDSHEEALLCWKRSPSRSDKGSGLAPSTPLPCALCTGPVRSPSVSVQLRIPVLEEAACFSVQSAAIPDSLWQADCAGVHRTCSSTLTSPGSQHNKGYTRH